MVNHLERDDAGFKGGGKTINEIAALEDVSTNPTSGEISVILRSAHNNGSVEGSYITRHLPLHRMISHLDRKGSQTPSSHGSPYERKGAASPPVKVTTTFTKEEEPQRNHKVSCITDIGTLVRRVKNVRVGFTPETRV